MMDTLIVILAALILLILLVNTFLTLKASKGEDDDKIRPLADKLASMENNFVRQESLLKDEIGRIRQEIGQKMMDIREELNLTLNNFNDSLQKFNESVLNRMSEIAGLQKNQLDTFSTQLGNLTKTNEDRLSAMSDKIDERLNNFQKEINENSKDSRNEMTGSLKSFEEKFTFNIDELNKLQKEKFADLKSAQELHTKSNEEKLSAMADKMDNRLDTTFRLIEEKLINFQRQIAENAREGREESSKSLKSFEDRFSASVEEFNKVQKEKFDNLGKSQNEQNKSNDLKLDKMRETIESKLDSIREDNNKKLEQMRETVDEKLHKTLEERLGQSFKIVSKQLESVHEGLGEMKKLATGVGDLKKVLSNVKTKGVLGEYQLENILDQILSPEQFDKNVKTKQNSGNFVEFAIKMPGKQDLDKPVWLPIDSKFPTEDYSALLEAYDQAEPDAIDKAKKYLADKIIRFAKDISGKYIDPPNTTDFAIMFLPIEGLYAEVLQNVSLFEILQRDYKVIITGPTTLSALLNSLQMGFRTLAIEKRSSEVWNILGAVKNEFGKFGAVLEKAQSKIKGVGDDLDKLVGVRSRQIERKLKNVETLPENTQLNLLGNGDDLTEQEN